MTAIDVTWIDDGPAIERHPAVLAARELSAELLTPQAAAVDVATVPRSHLDALGRAGLLATSAPDSAGGRPVPAAVARRIAEVLAGADLATWFVQAQHHSPVRMLARAPGHDGVLAQLARGELVAGIAFSHLRRWPQRPVEAVRDGDGWRLHGTAPWYTGWGINDVALLAGASPDGQAVFGLVRARDGHGLRASAAMELAALGATATVALHLDGVALSDADVVAVTPIGAWAQEDSRTTVNVNPAVFGVAESALDLLGALAQRRGEAAGRVAAERIGEQLREVRGRCYRLIDQVPPDEATAARLELRATAHEVMSRATTALVIAGAGASMSRANPAQRKAREGLFLLVQAQTGPARSAALEHLAGG